MQVLFWDIFFVLSHLSHCTPKCVLVVASQKIPKFINEMCYYRIILIPNLWCMNKFTELGRNGFPEWFHQFLPFLIPLVIWTLFWKGLALWHAGRRGQPWWFVILLVLNTVGILEIIYLFLILKMKFSKLFSK